jgi:hypothetical protein
MIFIHHSHYSFYSLKIIIFITLIHIISIYLDYLFIEISKFRPVMTFVTSMTFCDVTDVRRLTLRPKTNVMDYRSDIILIIFISMKSDSPASSSF